MMNDRPLTYVHSDPQDLQPLTPAHLLYGRRIQLAPRPLSDPENLLTLVLLMVLTLEGQTNTFN